MAIPPTAPRTEPDEERTKREERIRQEILGAVVRTTSNAPTPSVTPTDESMPIACLNCGGGTMVHPEADEYVCASCGVHIHFRKCPHCGSPGYFSNEDVERYGRALWGGGAPCGSCGHKAALRRWHSLTAREEASAYITDDASRECVADPNRRFVRGKTLAVSAFPPLAPNIGCQIVFQREGVYVMCLAEGGQYAPIALVPYANVGFLRIGGRGALQSGRTWTGGGFGLAGIAEGVLLAGALNALETETTTIETFIHLGCGNSELLMLNSKHTPKELEVMLAAVFGRIAAAQANKNPQQEGAGRDLVQQLLALDDLRTRGALTAAEFEKAKTKLLRDDGASRA